MTNKRKLFEPDKDIPIAFRLVTIKRFRNQVALQHVNFQLNDNSSIIFQLLLHTSTRLAALYFIELIRETPKLLAIRLLYRESTFSKKIWDPNDETPPQQIWTTYTKTKALLRHRRLKLCCSRVVDRIGSLFSLFTSWVGEGRGKWGTAVEPDEYDLADTFPLGREVLLISETVVRVLAWINATSTCSATELAKTFCTSRKRPTAARIISDSQNGGKELQPYAQHITPTFPDSK